MNKHRFVWHDLNTKDLDGAKQFYGDVFQWKLEGSANGPYVHITAGDQMIGGMRQMDANEAMPPSWLGYVGTDDVAPTVAKISAAGGKVYMPTKTMENVGTFAVTADPTGGVMKSPPGVPYSFWLPYVAVENTDSLCERASRLGAKVMVPPTDIPNVGRFACWSDPQQASIAVLQPAR